MKKVILIILMLQSFLIAENWFTGNAFGLWRAGVAIRDRNYNGVETIIGPGVFIFGGFGPVFIEANRAAYSVYRDGTYFVSLAGQLRTHQFRKEDAGYEDRKSTIELGAQVGRRLLAGFVTRLAFMHDITGNHKSWELDWQLFRRFEIGKLRLLSAVGLQYQNEKLVNYYYGSDLYKPKAALVGELEAILSYRLGDYGLFGGTRIYIFDKQVTKSPFASGSNINQFFFGAGYYF